MRKIEKETLQIIENYKSDIINRLNIEIKKLEKQIKKEVYDDFKKVFNTDEIESLIALFKNKYDNNIGITFELRIYEYDSNFREIFNNDPRMKKILDVVNEITEEKRKIKLALQCYDTNSQEYKEALETLYNQ